MYDHSLLLQAAFFIEAITVWYCEDFLFIPDNRHESGKNYHQYPAVVAAAMCWMSVKQTVGHVLTTMPYRKCCWPNSIWKKKIGVTNCAFRRQSKFSTLKDWVESKRGRNFPKEVGEVKFYNSDADVNRHQSDILRFRDISTMFKLSYWHWGNVKRLTIQPLPESQRLYFSCVQRLKDLEATFSA